jgi:ergothioneine biosynthesis protein EgtB
MGDRTSPHRSADLADRYRTVRAVTERLREPLSAEDCQVQSMDDASPTKWHLAHTTWFFETFVLEPAVARYRPYRAEYRVLFNSYYNTVGVQHPRPRRGLLTRPPLEDVLAYRAHIDRQVLELLAGANGRAEPLGAIVELGLHHEQQHQELLLTDAKHLLSANPLRPTYRERKEFATGRRAPALGWRTYPRGSYEIGYQGRGFAFDNEQPCHAVLLEAFALASRPATNAEFLAFIEDGGYRRPELWLSDGWNALTAGGWAAPLYWEQRDGAWYEFTLAGMRPLVADAPVCHVSYYEADAFASWRGARLPSEAEWEVAAAGTTVEGNLLERGALHPLPAPPSDAAVRQLFGDVWEWTRSAYAAYPGYRPLAGALGEYNGKFMCNQLVLRGGSCATPISHLRATYRNFFPPSARWQFSGIRLAKDA